MKYNNYFEKIDEYITIRLPKGLEIVEMFLCSDGYHYEDIIKWYIDGIDMVLNDKSDYEVRSGEVCRLEIKKDFTKVISIYSEDNINKSNEIETVELRELLILQMEEKRKFDKEYKGTCNKEIL